MLTIYDLFSLLIALFGWIFAGTATYSLMRRVRTGEDKWANGGPEASLRRHVETEIRGLSLRVEKNEAHWDAMYAKFDRLQRSSKQRGDRDRLADEAAAEVVPPKELTRDEQRMELRKRIHAGG